METLRDAYLLDVDKSSRPLQRFQEGSRLLKAAEEIVAVAQGLQKEFWDFWVMSHEARYLEIMRGLQESGDAVGAVIFARRYEGWAYYGEEHDQDLLLDEVELLRSTLGLSEAVRTATGRHIKGNHDASGATQRAPDAEAVPETLSVLQSESSARALNEWLANRRLQQEGETYADEIGRMTEAVNRRVPQLRYAPAERQGVHRMARDVAAGRNSSDSQVFGGLM